MVTLNEYLGDEEPKKNLLNRLFGGDFSKAFRQGFEMTSEDRRDYIQFIRDVENKAEAPRASMTFIQHPGIDVLRQAQVTGDVPGMGIPKISDQSLLYRGNYGMNAGPQQQATIPEIFVDDSADVRKAKEKKIAKMASNYRKELKKLSPATKSGYALGSLASDLTNDASRNLWWLFNASQAIGNIGSEFVANTVNPALFEKESLSLEDAEKAGWVKYKEPDDSSFDPSFETEAEWNARQRADRNNYGRDAVGVRISKDPGSKHPVGRRRFNQNAVQLAATLPIGLAINSGIGLMGRQDGYAATVPNADDPRKSDNLLAEGASRYFLGREGNLLPVEDFLMERPDVTPAEYNAYKGYLRDRDIDLNIFDDGKLNLGGVVKTNPDGIRGAEVSFLGKSLPVNDTWIPALSALAGTAAGAYVPRRLGVKNKAAVLGTLFGGGMGGLLAGTTAGNAMENERRRRNFNERNPNTDYDKFKGRTKDLLDKKMKMTAANPNAAAEREQSGVGFNKRVYQQSLLDNALNQQIQIDSIASEGERTQANAIQNEQLNQLAKAGLIDRQMRYQADGMSSYEAAQRNYDEATAIVAERWLAREAMKQAEKERG